MAVVAEDERMCGARQDDELAVGVGQLPEEIEQILLTGDPVVLAAGSRWPCWLRRRARPSSASGWKIGLLVGSFAMAGDLFSSFCKRRLSLPSSSRASGLDQIPESLLPLLACRDLLALTAADIVVCVAMFVIGEVVLSRLLYAVRLCDRPY